MGEAFTFKGRVAVVTGAAQGIGFHLAKKLCENGMKVAFVDLNGETNGSRGSRGRRGSSGDCM